MVMEKNHGGDGEYVEGENHCRCWLRIMHREESWHRDERGSREGIFIFTTTTTEIWKKKKKKGVLMNR